MRDAILDRSTRVEKLSLGENITPRGFRQRFDAYQRCITDTSCHTVHNIFTHNRLRGLVSVLPLRILDRAMVSSPRVGVGVGVGDGGRGRGAGEERVGEHRGGGEKGGKEGDGED